MKTVTIEQDGSLVTITTSAEDGITSGEMLEMVYDAMMGLGYHPASIAEDMIEMGEQRLPGDTQ